MVPALWFGLLLTAVLCHSLPSSDNLEGNFSMKNSTESGNDRGFDDHGRLTRRSKRMGSMHDSRYEEEKRLPPTDAKVIILGGGVSGISAIKALVKAGITDIILLEARKDTLGGRLHNIEWPESSGNIIEIGGNWSM
jgi:hypothetical protein